MLVLRVDDVAVAEEVSRAVHGLLDTGQRAKPVRFRGRSCSSYRKGPESYWTG